MTFSALSLTAAAAAAPSGGAAFFIQTAPLILVFLIFYFLMIRPQTKRMKEHRAQIEAVRVSAGHRGSGTGRTLVEWAIEQAARRGCGLVQLTTDAARVDAHRWYASLGFRPTHAGMKLALKE